jgi:hypothetical protein
VRRICDDPPIGELTTTVLQLLLHCEPSVVIVFDVRCNVIDVEEELEPSTSENCAVHQSIYVYAVIYSMLWVDKNIFFIF